MMLGEMLAQKKKARKDSIMNGSTKEGMETHSCSGALEGIKYEHPVSGVETPLVQSPDIVCCIG